MMSLIMRMLRSRGAGGGDFAYHFLLSLFAGFVVWRPPRVRYLEKARRFIQARTGWIGGRAGAWGRSMI